MAQNDMPETPGACMYTGTKQAGLATAARAAAILPHLVRQAVAQLGRCQSGFSEATLHDQILLGGIS